ncbi:SURF1 family protein [Nocardioides insulae]|uniref:SURF1 family protein n=1 Tax=Nocardioides insulae TaxID=394734 RepID=UPI00041A8CC5|nr:SURF1 family protein [Nocardioides insulae]
MSSPAVVPIWHPKLWAAHALGLACVVVATLLGLWQLDSWQHAREVEAMDLTSQAPVPLEDLLGSDDPFPGAVVGHPVDAAGVWVPEGTVYISGRESDGADGYWVVTPLAIDGSGDPAIPVVRGWVADPAEAPAAPTGPGEVTGWLQPAEGTGAVDEDRTDDVIPQLRVADVIQHVDQDLYSGYIVSEDPVGAPEPATLEQLPEAGTFTALRNLLYAIEWWIFGLFAVFIWWRYVRDVTHPEPDEEGEDRSVTDRSVGSPT